MEPDFRDHSHFHQVIEEIKGRKENVQKALDEVYLSKRFFNLLSKIINNDFGLLIARNCIDIQLFYIKSGEFNENTLEIIQKVTYLLTSNDVNPIVKKCILDVTNWPTVNKLDLKLEKYVTLPDGIILTSLNQSKLIDVINSLQLDSEVIDKLLSTL